VRTASSLCRFDARACVQHSIERPPASICAQAGQAELAKLLSIARMCRVRRTKSGSRRRPTCRRAPHRLVVCAASGLVEEQSGCAAKTPLRCSQTVGNDSRRLRRLSSGHVGFCSGQTLANQPRRSNVISDLLARSLRPIQCLTLTGEHKGDSQRPPN
jgi:hypothetical protein